MVGDGLGDNSGIAGSKGKQTVEPKQRFLAAIKGAKPDRLPVTTHHVLPYYLKKYMNGSSTDEFFDCFGLDPIVWTVPHRPDEGRGEYYHSGQKDVGFLQSRLISSDRWRIEWEEIPGQKYATLRYTIVTPKGKLTMVLESNEYTSWVTEHLVKQKGDIELIGEFVTAPKCDVQMVNRIADQYGQKALIRGHVCCFDIFGQPGCWQDAACLFGIEKLIMATFDDPKWVHEFLRILFERKKTFAESLKGAKYDILELGGGDASSTVISPRLFEDFVMPYDAELIKTTHDAGQRISYHTCGGMMPILEKIASMKPDAMETFTPPSMGGDAVLKDARQRIPSNICMIGGFDQFHFFTNCTPEQTRAEVRKFFNDAGKYGGCILAPSDHFFDAQPELITAFADEAIKCIY